MTKAEYEIKLKCYELKVKLLSERSEREEQLAKEENKKDLEDARIGQAEAEMELELLKLQGWTHT